MHYYYPDATPRPAYIFIHLFHMADPADTNDTVWSPVNGLSMTDSSEGAPSAADPGTAEDEESASFSLEESSEETEPENSPASSPSHSAPELLSSMDFEFPIEIPALSKFNSDAPLEIVRVPLGPHWLVLFVIKDQEKRQISAFFTCVARIISIDLNVTLLGDPFKGRRAFSHFASFSELQPKATIRPQLFDLDDLPSAPVPGRIALHLIPDVKLSRSYFGCVGLANLGMTCYLNSLIQCLFHLKPFRKMVFEINNPKSQIATELKFVFGKMQTVPRPVATRELTEAFGWDGDELWEQQDVQELMHFLLDRLDDSSGGRISELFKGKMASYVRCDGRQESWHEEIFWDLSVQVEGYPDLDSSIRAFFAPDELTGNNQYELPDGTKVDAVKETEIIDTPPVLCLHLRRFAFVKGVQEKISSRFDFPDHFVFKTEEYELSSVIAHFGHIYVGHYCAYAKVDGIWTNFNDEQVRRCESDEVFQELVGGDYFTAYVLFYVKVGINDIPTPEVPRAVIGELEKRRSLVRIIFQFGNWGGDSSQALSCDRGLSSEEFVKLLADETGIPEGDVVVRELGDIGPANEAIEHPLPNPGIRMYVDNAVGVPVAVRFWFPGHEIAFLQVFHVTVGASIEDVAIQVRQALEIGDVPLKCYFDIDPSAAGLEASGDITQAIKLLFEPTAPVVLDDRIVKKFDIRPAELPQIESHLQLLRDEIQIASVTDFISLIKRVATMTFKSFDEGIQFRLSLSEDLTFAQTILCVARHLGVDPDLVVLIHPSNGFVPMRSDQYPAFRDMKRRRRTLIFEVAPMSIRTSYRADVTVVEPLKHEVLKRFPVYLPRGAARVSDLRAEIDERLGNKDYSLIYITDHGPKGPIGDDKEVTVNCRIVAQLGRIDPLDETSQMFLKVLYTDSFLFGSDGENDIPFILRVPCPIKWKDVQALCEGKTITLVRRGKQHLEKVTADDDYWIDGTKKEMVAITYDIDVNEPARLATSAGAPLRMRKEFHDGAEEEDRTPSEAEEEEEGEEDEEEEGTE
jgi:ubiquitin C-terminal hydrolase